MSNQISSPILVKKLVGRNPKPATYYLRDYGDIILPEPQY